MHIPNDLNRLLAQLQQVTSAARRGSGRQASGIRPSDAEVDQFLRRYSFTSVAIEQIEISKDGVFECYMFAIQDPATDELSLLTM